MTRASSTVPKRQLGMALRKLREAKRVERDVPAGVLDCSVSKIWRIEAGDVSVKAVELRALLNLYEVSGEEREDLELLAVQARGRRKRTPYGSAIPDWFRKYVSLEEVAIEIRSYDTELVPGLCQTEDYARAVTRASPLSQSGALDRAVAARMARQARVFGDDPAHVWVVLSEAVLHREIGGPDVLRRQVAHLRELADLPNVTVQVSRFDQGAHAATGFSFSLVKLPNSDGLDIVYLEDLTSARYIDRDAEEQQRYGIIWNYLVRSALPPKETADLLESPRMWRS